MPDFVPPPEVPDFVPPPLPPPPEIPGFDPPSSGTGGDHNDPDDSNNSNDEPKNQRNLFDEVIKDTPIGITSLIIAVFFLLFFLSALESAKAPRNKEWARICYLLACACASFAVYFETGGVTHLGTGAGIATGIVEIVFLSLGNSLLFSTLFAVIRVRLRKFLIVVTLFLLSAAGFTAAAVVANPNGILFDSAMIAYNSLLLITALIFWFKARQANKQDGTKFTHWSSKYLGLWLASAATVLLILAALDRITNPNLAAAAITGNIFDSTDIILDSESNLPMEVLNFLLGKVITWGIATVVTTSLMVKYFSPKGTEKLPERNLVKV